MNSKLNREVAEYDQHLVANRHSLLGSGPIYQPSGSTAENEQLAEATVHVLGRGEGATSLSNASTAAERRQQVLDATLRRLKIEEKEIEDMCGSGQQAD